MRTFLIIATMASCLSAFAVQPAIKFNESDPDVHDPVMARGEDGRFYIFSTGMNVSAMSSQDLKTWKREPAVLDKAPGWAMDTVPGYRGHTWAPDIYRHNGKWYLYYSCSTFGKNGSAIGVAVNNTLDPASPDFHWEDKGMVIASHRNLDDWNAIDPNLFFSSDDQPYLTYGSFWDGIQLIKLSKDDLRTPVTKPVTIARRNKLRIGGKNFTVENGDTIEAGDNAIEAPFVYKNDSYYYLFVSHDYCCRGEKSTYRTVYGRSKNPEGPYIDKEGRLQSEGGGTFLFGPDRENFGIGHCSVYNFDGNTYFISHAYKKEQDGKAKLFIRRLNFDSEGWISGSSPII